MSDEALRKETYTAMTERLDGEEDARQVMVAAIAEIFDNSRATAERMGKGLHVGTLLNLTQRDVLNLLAPVSVSSDGGGNRETT